MSGLPPYVIDGNLYDSLAAVQLQNVIMHNFCVPADQTKLQTWLDKTFATPSGGAVRYRAVTDKVFLGIAQIGKLFIPNGSSPPKGYTSEIDITLWILAQREDDGVFALRWIPAYLFVDSGPALVSGREVWGFPKQLGQFEFSSAGQGGGSARTFNAKGWVVSPFGPESPARWATMFEVRPTTPKPPSGVFATLEALASRTLARLGGGLSALAGRLEAALGAGVITMAFLKQFPDAAQPSLACYQAVVEAEARVTKLRGSGVTDNDYEVRITSFDSHPYLSELGIASDWQSVGDGVWMDFDFEQALGREVWRAGGPA